MRHHTTRVLLVTSALVLISSGGGRAKADQILNHASTSAQAIAGTDGPNLGHLTSHASASGSGHGEAASASADVSLVPPPGLSQGFLVQLNSSAQVSATDYSSPSANAAAQWRDILYLGSTFQGLVGNTLRLNFSGQGSHSYSGGDSAGGSTSKLTAEGTNENQFTVNAYHTSSADTSVDALDVFRHKGWDPTFQGDKNFYSGTFHLDIPILPGGGYVPGTPGSFYFQFTDVASIAANYGAIGPFPVASRTVADPFQMISITLPDVGNVTPESLGVSLTFDSGMSSPNIAATPEPSSLTLAWFGAGCLFVYARRRRSGGKGSGAVAQAP